MFNEFLFSFEHLMLIIFFIIFLYTCLKTTKSLLCYGYIVEKVICALFLSEIIFKQLHLYYIGEYSLLNSLPISISNITAFMCIGILYFKNYRWFDLFFSWALVCSFGEIIFFESMPTRFPDALYFSSLFSKCLLLFAVIYLVEVRKFKVEKIPFKENIFCSVLYFIAIFSLNTVTNSNYTYFLSNSHPFSLFVFIGLTSLIYKLNEVLNYEEPYNI